MPLSPGRFWTLLVVTLFVALALRVGVTARFQGLSSPPSLSANPDALEYELIAFNLSTGNGYGFTPGAPTAVRPPGTPLTLLPPYLLLGRSFLALHLWVILLSASTCAIVAWLGTQLGGRRVGLVSAAWLAVYPGHFYYAMHFLSEPVYGFWLALSCGLCVWALLHHSIRADVAAGVCWALAVLTRVELIIAVPIAWALLAIASRSTRSRAFPHVAIQSVVALLIVSLWVGRNVVVLGAPSLSTQRGYTFWGAHNRLTMTDPRYMGSWISVVELEKGTRPLSGTGVERDRQAFEYGLETVRENASRMPYITLMKLWRFASPFFETSNRAALWALACGWIVTAPFVARGAWMLVTACRDRLPWTVLLLPMLATVAMGAVFYGSPRFRDALSPLFVVIAAYGVTSVTERPAAGH